MINKIMIMLFIEGMYFSIVQSNRTLKKPDRIAGINLKLEIRLICSGSIGSIYMMPINTIRGSFKLHR